MNHCGTEDIDFFKCKILHNSCMIATGEGKTKKKAEQDAAYRALVIGNVLSEN